jgi:hypothetical protein
VTPVKLAPLIVTVSPVFTVVGEKERIVGGTWDVFESFFLQLKKTVVKNSNMGNNMIGQLFINA